MRPYAPYLFEGSIVVGQQGQTGVGTATPRARPSSHAFSLPLAP